MDETIVETDHKNGHLECINEEAGPPKTFCLVQSELANSRDLLDAIAGLSFHYVISTSQDDLASFVESKDSYYFVCEKFEGADFEWLRKQHCRIFGPLAILRIFHDRIAIPRSHRPLYNCSMCGVVMCFTGFRKKDELTELCHLVRNMGGSIRLDVTGRVTHLVANSVQSDKYRLAVSFGANIMTEQWVRATWDNRNTETFDAVSPAVVEKYRMKPFHGLKLSFLGFQEDERVHMEETAVQNGAIFLPVGDPLCTHLVVEENSVTALPDEGSFANVLAVRQEWFWASIQIDACTEEKLYLFNKDDGSTPSSVDPYGHKAKKRRRLKLGELSSIYSPESPANTSQRRATKDRLSTASITSLDYSLGSPATEQIRSAGTPDEAIAKEKPISKRHQRVLELQDTERNYVKVLSTIITTFKIPIEESADQRAGALLETEEIKTIFGSIPDILEVHTSLLEQLDKEIAQWNEERPIGKIVADHASKMIRVYPHFVNFFEMVKETVVKCDTLRPRFHAFLKICLMKPECARQSLTELLIRPVQRIPSMSLLLNDILKHTSSSNPDHQHLKKAVDTIKCVLTHINEDKRKTEGQVQMFEIVREIDDCPAYILSSNRSLITKADMFEVTEGLSQRGTTLTMFLFTDSIEVVKKRNGKVMAGSIPMKSPAAKTPQKAYKHLEFIPLTHIKSLVDVTEVDDCRNVFGMIYHSLTDLQDKLFLFKLVGENDKSEWLQILVKSITDTNSTADTENLLTTMEPQDLMLKKSDWTEGGTLSRAFRKARKTTKRVTRAFSLNKTPKGNHTIRRTFSNLTPNESRCETTSPTPSECIDLDSSFYDGPTIKRKF